MFGNGREHDDSALQFFGEHHRWMRDKLTSILQEVESSKLQKPDFQTVNLFNGVPFSYQGYRYAGIIAPTGVTSTVDITWSGVSWTVKLAEGYQELNVPEGARMTCSDEVLVILVKSNWRFQ